MTNIKEAIWVGLSMCCLGSPSWSQEGISAEDLAITAIYCESVENDEHIVLLFGREGENVFTLPDRLPVTMVSNVMSFARGDGLFSLTANRFQFLSDDAAASGVCIDFSDNLTNILNGIAAQYPDALRNSAGYLMASAEISAANAAISKTRLEADDRIAKAKADAETIRKEWELAKSGLAKAKEAANDEAKLKLAAEIAKLSDDKKKESKELANMRARFENEQRINTKLKARICELDPSSTFAVCK